MKTKQEILEYYNFLFHSFKYKFLKNILKKNLSQENFNKILKITNENDLKNYLKKNNLLSIKYINLFFIKD